MHLTVSGIELVALGRGLDPSEHQSVSCNSTKECTSLLQRMFGQELAAIWIAPTIHDKHTAQRCWIHVPIPRGLP